MNMKKIANLILILVLCVAFTVPAAAADDVKGLNVTKEAVWQDGGKTVANINITAEAVGKVYDNATDTPNILFIGAYANGGVLTESQLQSILTNIAKVGNVDYYLSSLHPGQNATVLRKATEPYYNKNYGSMHKGATAPAITRVGNTSTLGGMLDNIYEALTTSKKYDAIVISFDDETVAKNYGKTNSDLTKNVPASRHEWQVAELLKPYYEQDKVIWITNVTDANYAGSADFDPSTFSSADLSVSEYMALMALVAPDRYNMVTDDYSDCKLSYDRQTSYTYAGVDVYPAIAGVLSERYSLSFSDKIDLTNGSIKGAHFEKSLNGTVWTQTSEGTITIGEDGTVTGTFDKLKRKQYIRLVIEVELGTGFTGDPSVGNAEVAMKTESSSAPVVKEAELKNQLDQLIHITYKSENNTKGSVSVEGECVEPTGQAQGCEAIPAENLRFVNWTDNDGNVVSADVKLVPDMAEGDNADTTYIAHCAVANADTVDGDESINPNDTYTPNVLYVGTLCCGHGMNKDAVVEAVNTLATTSNVDYFLFNKGAFSFYDVAGTVEKGQKLSAYEMNCIDLHTYNHHTLGKFLDAVYQQLHAKGANYYDLIVLQFDGSRIADLYGDDRFNPTSGYEVRTMELLSDYYDQDKVIWKTDSDIPYYPTYKYDRGGNGKLELKLDQYRALMALVCPEHYYDVTLMDYVEYNNSLASMLSVGDIVIISVVTVLALGGVAALIIVNKKKKLAFSGDENE
ncbi:MAG: hypothetical protein MJ101_04765 [Clostridia bacterium]|nr:hypothetical protein [Clostridia bacterium]